MTPFVTLLLSSICLLPYGSALQVTPGSTCAAFCLDNPESDPLSPDSSNTTPRDITCTDDSYDNSATGIKFKNCLDCLQKSNATSDTESDVSWFLYNIRYSLDVCLFGFPEAVKGVSSPCTTNWACQPLTAALEAGDLDAGRNQLEYCTADGNFTTAHHIDDCIKCFASSPNQAHMSNFMTALKAGCQQRPAPGDLIGLSDSLFSGSPVNITSLPTETPTGNKDSGFGITSTGAIVGIAIGGALLLIGGLALFWIYHRRQKRAYGGLPSQHSDSRAGNRSITPFGSGFSEKRAQSQTSHYELQAQRNYANNAEYYNMLEKESQASRAQYALNPNNAMAGPHGVLPTHPAYLPRTHSRQASRESSPQPPRSVKTNKPDSYALQAYLSAAEDAGAPDLLPPPPPGPPPAAVLSDPSRFRGPSPNRYALHSRDSSVDNRGPSPDRRPLLNPAVQSAPTAPNPPPPPPPPPSTRASKVPSLAFPSVPRLRMPKKYTPPRIAVQEATPTSGPSDPVPQFGTEQQQADISIGLDISNPVMPTDAEPRVFETHWNRRRQPPPPLVIDQAEAAARRRPPQWTMTAEAGARTGNSTLYG
ncbi:hypothetical protein F5Y14DRAFT_417140 [Nemania sp. NC0429]|nr:hypothetical protein F5Y14DRAFT_417140 [Nemania sp. NC0429]